MLLFFPNQPFPCAAIFLAVETCFIKTMNSVHLKIIKEIFINFRGTWESKSYSNIRISLSPPKYIHDMNCSVRCGSQISNYSGTIPHLNCINLIPYCWTAAWLMPSLSETSKSLKVNKEEVLRNLFTIGESIRCFSTLLFPLLPPVSNCRRMLSQRTSCIFYSFGGVADPRATVTFFFCH